MHWNPFKLCKTTRKLVCLERLSLLGTLMGRIRFKLWLKSSYQLLLVQTLWFVSVLVWLAWLWLLELWVSRSATCPSTWSCSLCLTESMQTKSINYWNGLWGRLCTKKKWKHSSCWPLFKVLTCFSRFPHHIWLLVNRYGWTSRRSWSKQHILNIKHTS